MLLRICSSLFLFLCISFPHNLPIHMVFRLLKSSLRREFSCTYMPRNSYIIHQNHIPIIYICECEAVNYIHKYNILIPDANHQKNFCFYIGKCSTKQNKRKVFFLPFLLYAHTHTHVYIFAASCSIHFHEFS